MRTPVVRLPLILLGTVAASAGEPFDPNVGRHIQWLHALDGRAPGIAAQRVPMYGPPALPWVDGLSSSNIIDLVVK